MKKTNNQINYIYYFLYLGCFAFFLFAAYNTVTNPQNLYWDVDTEELRNYIIVVTVCLIVTLLILQPVFEKFKLSPYILFALLIYLQFIALEKLPVEYYNNAWDMNVVYSAAKDFVAAGQFNSEVFYDYFLWFPNNNALYNLLVCIMKFFKAVGIQNFEAALNVVNTVFIDIAVICIYKSAYLTKGRAFACNALSLCLITCPFVVFSVVMYTDTVAMMFVSLGMYYYFKILMSKGNKWLNVIAFSLAVAIGSQFKVTVMILLIGAVIDLLLKNKKIKNIFATIAVVMLATLLLYFPMKQANDYSLFLPTYDYNYSIPYTHWVMMGLNGLGNYCDEDYQEITLKYPDKASRKQANIIEIKNRIEEKGAEGMSEHLKNKLSYACSDGTYSALLILDRHVKNNNNVRQAVIFSGKYFEKFGYTTLAIMVLMLSFSGIGGLIALITKDDNPAFYFICFIGLMIFLLLWETITRYIVHFLPICILSFSYGISGVFKLLHKKKILNDEEKTLQTIGN